MKVCLDLHDFSVVHNRLDVLLKLKDLFPNFKVSLFTIPVDKQEDWGPSLIREDFLKEIKKHLDWIQIIPHGYGHNGREMRNMDYYTFKEQVIPAIKKRFEEDGLPYEGGFVAPHWDWTEGVVRALDEEGWWGAIDRDKIIPCPKKYYQYNFLLNEPFWEADYDLKLHGHVYGTRNDIGRCFDNILRLLPKNPEWCFVTDFLQGDIK